MSAPASVAEIDIFRSINLWQASKMYADVAERGHARHRRPDAGGYACGEQTRARIVTAALKIFGEEGYERASTRRIAEQAGVKPPALQYYFEGKEGLHRACAERILARAGALFDTLAKAEARLAREGATSAISGIYEILDVLIDLSCKAEPDPGRLAFLIRAQTEDAGPGLPLFRERLVRPLQATTARLIAATLGRDPEDPLVRLKATMVLAQAHAFQGARANTLAFLGWPDFSGDRAEFVKHILHAHTRATLLVETSPC